MGKVEQESAFDELLGRVREDASGNRTGLLWGGVVMMLLGGGGAAGLILIEMKIIFPASASESITASVLCSGAMLLFLFLPGVFMIRSGLRDVSESALLQLLTERPKELAGMRLVWEESPSMGVRGKITFWEKASAVYTLYVPMHRAKELVAAVVERYPWVELQ